LIILDDQYFADMETALSEVKARKAFTVVITNCTKKLEKTKEKIDILIELPSD